MKLHLKSAQTGAAHEYEANGNAVVIGRDPACDVPLPGEEMVSSRHTRLEQTPHGIVVSDLGSTVPI